MSTENVLKFTMPPIEMRFLWQPLKITRASPCIGHPWAWISCDVQRRIFTTPSYHCYTVPEGWLRGVFFFFLARGVGDLYALDQGAASSILFLPQLFTFLLCHNNYATDSLSFHRIGTTLANFSLMDCKKRRKEGVQSIHLWMWAVDLLLTLDYLS